MATEQGWIPTSSEQRPGLGIIILANGKHISAGRIWPMGMLTVGAEVYDFREFDYWLPIPPLPGTSDAKRGLTD